jgi:serine/threonine protein kinase
VALKILKPGMDTRQVVARFEAERQALALMEHPNIARVLDGGQTSGGRHYFIMDLVKGLPITDYCDQEQLTPRERLDLFVHLCRAVQHAHQKGVIHRDLKPSNVMVTVHDTTPVVKVARLEDPHGDRAAWLGLASDGGRLAVVARYARAVHVWDLRAIRRQLRTMNLDWDGTERAAPPERRAGAGHFSPEEKRP